MILFFRNRRALYSPGYTGAHRHPARVPLPEYWLPVFHDDKSSIKYRLSLPQYSNREDPIFEKWDLPCSNIGAVTDDTLLSFYHHGKLEASIPAEELVLGGGAPQYTRENKEPAYFEKIKSFDAASIPQIT